MSWFASNLLSAFLLPPFNVILLGATGFLLLKRRPRLGKLMVWSALALLYLLSIPFVAEALLQRLETPPERGPFLEDAIAVTAMCRQSSCWVAALTIRRQNMATTQSDDIACSAYVTRRNCIAERENLSWRLAVLLWEASHLKRRK